MTLTRRSFLRAAAAAAGWVWFSPRRGPLYPSPRLYPSPTLYPRS